MYIKKPLYGTTTTPPGEMVSNNIETFPHKDYYIGKQRALSLDFVMNYRLFHVKGYARLP